MAITYIEIDTSALESDIRELNANTSRAKKSLEALSAELEELYGMWTGKASLAFKVQANGDCKAMENMLAGLDKLAECMTHAGREYVRCENQVNELVKDIRV